MSEVIEFFNSLAPSWDEMCHHDVKKIKRLLDLIVIREGAEILDVGCGTGILESFLLDYHPKCIVAIDLASKMIEKAKEKYNQEVIEFRCMDVMALREDQYDYIIIYSAFPHFLEPENFIAHMNTLLKKGGKLVICHSESKERINGHHNEKASWVSRGLLPAQEVGKMMEPYLEIQIMLDTEELYLVSGVKCC